MTFMGELIGAIIVYLVLRLIFKILKGIYSSLFDSNNDQEPVIEDTSNPIEDSEPVVENKEPVVEETSSHDVRDDKPSDLKYNNEVYISFRNIVYKAYESFKESGYNIMWESDRDRFIIYEDDKSSDSDSILYIVKVCHDDRNLVELNDSFYILVTYGAFFDRLYYDNYKEKAEYLNNYLHKELKKTAIFYTVENIEYSKVAIYYCNIEVGNIKALCEHAEKMGEAELIKELMSDAERIYYNGENEYLNKLSRDAVKDFSN